MPEINASPAYKEGGLIAITFDQAPQAGPNADSSSCCATPEYPNLPPPSTATAGRQRAGQAETGGGGRVGMLLISPYVKAGSVNETGYYNHFSLLRSIEELFGQQPLGYAAEPGAQPVRQHRVQPPRRKNRLSVQENQDCGQQAEHDAADAEGGGAQPGGRGSVRRRAPAPPRRCALLP